jgi:hypothetical protein
MEREAAKRHEKLKTREYAYVIFDTVSRLANHRSHYGRLFICLYGHTNDVSS